MNNNLSENDKPNLLRKNKNDQIQSSVRGEGYQDTQENSILIGELERVEQPHKTNSIRNPQERCEQNSNLTITHYEGENNERHLINIFYHHTKGKDRVPRNTWKLILEECKTKTNSNFALITLQNRISKYIRDPQNSEFIKLCKEKYDRRSDSEPSRRNMPVTQENRNAGESIVRMCHSPESNQVATLTTSEMEENAETNPNRTEENIAQRPVKLSLYKIGRAHV